MLKTVDQDRAGTLVQWSVGVKYIGQGEMKFSGFSSAFGLKNETSLEL